MLRSDTWIRTQTTENGMITPFVPELVRKVDDTRVLSYGCSSYGYDLRLSPREFLIFRHVPGCVVDPKCFDLRNLEPTPLYEDDNGKYFILPGHSYGLGVALERLEIPADTTCLFIGKSTYARCGLIVNTTPGEAGWRGHLTLEFSNSSGADCRIYANEGICQALFFSGEPCDVTYDARSGKYQHQPEAVTTALV